MILSASSECRIITYVIAVICFEISSFRSAHEIFGHGQNLFGVF